MLPDYEKLGAFYLGKTKPDGAPLLYDSSDLVTHAVCVGMTGSGKTGLCIGLLEEAAIDGIPAIVIDPKGDLANLLLTFPELRAADFEPWINADEARNQGMDPAVFAAHQADLWKKGLASWNQDGERIALLKNAAEFTVYTPGSDAGVPVSILASFAAPDDKGARRSRGHARPCQRHRDVPPRLGRYRRRPRAEPRTRLDFELARHRLARRQESRSCGAHRANSESAGEKDRRVGPR
ncbi:MAG: DUF87 domain-containing protein [Acidobacteriota bacterium]